MKPEVLVIFIPSYFCVMAHYTYIGLAQRRFAEWQETLAVP
jgi:hypothetical protein